MHTAAYATPMTTDNEHTEPRRIVVVHPDDVNLADAKAQAAKYDATVVANPYCPRGKMLLIDPAALRFDPGATTT